MKILVTGGKGFIGSHLVKELSKGHSVISFDIKDGSKKDVRVLKNLLKSSKNVDVIVHLAALCLDHESVKKPWEYLTTNIFGTINVLETARRLKIKKVINASSAGADLNSHYGISKLHGEQLCELYSRIYKMNVISLRIFNVYGEKNNKGVIKNFFMKIKNNSLLTIYGDGEYTRDYIHVRDVVNTIKDFIKKNLGSGIYEIGTGIGTSVNELVKIMEEITGKKMETKSEPVPYDGIEYSIATNPCVTNPIKLRDGLKELWKKNTF